jgi:uncharacterized damage-inducible protein DinB
MNEAALRDHLARVLDWGDAHATFDDAVKDLKPELRGRRPDGFPHSPWELVEHLRIAQRDILDFCVAERYEEHAWPDDYWPASPEPLDAGAWDRSTASYCEDREAFQQLVRDPAIDLTAATPHAAKAGQTYLRAILLLADHTAYHVGQLILARRLLSAWPVE